MGSTTVPTIDVLIIGGGPAGLAVATGLARQLYTAVVFDSGVYRNAMAPYMHNVVTWDHQDPAVFRQKAHDQILNGYTTIEFQKNTKIECIKRTKDGQFQVTDTTGRVWIGRKLVLATGIKDVFPDIDGYDDCWGKGIFHCLFCHGYEDRGCNSAGVLAVGDIAIPGPAIHMARMANRMTPNVTIYTDGAEELGEQMKLALKESITGIKVDKRRIIRLEKGADKSEVLMFFEDGGEEREGFLVHKPKGEVNGPFAHQLLLELTEQGDIKTTQPFHESSMPGVFAIGDCATILKAVSTAISMGAVCAAGLATQLQVEPF